MACGPTDYPDTLQDEADRVPGFGRPERHGSVDLSKFVKRAAGIFYLPTFLPSYLTFSPLPSFFLPFLSRLVKRLETHSGGISIAPSLVRVSFSSCHPSPHLPLRRRHSRHLAMEVLPPPPCFSVPATAPTLFTDCINVSQPRPIKAPVIPLLAPSTPASPSNSQRPARFNSSLPLTKLVSPPLPTIPASPICNTIPTSNESCQSPVDFAPGHNDRSIPAQKATLDKDTTPPGSHMSLHMLLEAPIWISTPPTPPRKPISKNPSPDPQSISTPVLASASFPATAPLHAASTCALKRCLSSPTTSSRLRITSDPALNFDISRLPRQSDNTCIEEQPESPFRPPSEFSGSTYASSLMDLSPANSGDTHYSNTDIRTEDLKDVVRILHALRELLATELDYVRDLRILSVGPVQDGLQAFGF